MNCLLGYIGVLGCGNVTPVSGRYVNTLPGISLRVIDNTANSEQITYAAVFDAVQERAVADFSTKVTALFAEKYRLKKVLQSIDLGELVSTTTNQTQASAEYRGFTYELKQANNKYFKPSALQLVFVQTVRVYLKVSAAFTVKIFDLDKQKEIYTKTVSSGMVVGWNTVAVHQGFSAFRIFVATDCTSVESPYQEVNQYALDCCNTCVHDLYGYDCDGRIRGAQADVSNPYTVAQGNNTFGISAEFSLTCSFDNVVCKNLKTFENAWWYKLGEHIMIQRLTSPRVNLTTIDTKEAEELRNYYASMFEEDLKLSVRGIDLDLSDCCIECDAPITYRESRM